LTNVPPEAAVSEVLAYVNVAVFIVVAREGDAEGDDPPDLEKQSPDVHVRLNQAMKVVLALPPTP
jgi:hypothetical protein